MITVITVSYNAHKVVETTICSILKQENVFFELILVDGASSDNTLGIALDIVDEMKKNTNSSFEFFYISEKDNGIYDAMNKGVSMSHGDYIIFMNCGDSFFDNTVLEKFEKEISLSNADAYYGQTLLHLYEGKGILHENEESKLNPVMPFIHQSVIVKRDLLLMHPFNTDYKILADYDLFYWMRKQKYIFKYCSFIVSIYDAKEGLSENNPLQITYERDRILGRDKNQGYWRRKIILRCTIGLIQPIKDIAPRWILNIYFRKKKSHLTWVD